jgi:hypothetical protein
MNPSPFNLNLALVIGINDYQNGIPALGTAKQDAEAIAISKLLIQKCDRVAAPTEHRTERQA